MAEIRPVKMVPARSPLPARTVGSLVYNTANTSINLNVTAVDSIVWRGDLSATWDVGTAIGTGGTNNWRLSSNPATATNFVQGDAVRFDDTGTATTVTIPASVQPSGVTVTGAANYTFQGAGGIDGSTRLTKSGTGTLTLLSANGYTGPTVIAAGSVVVEVQVMGEAEPK